MARRINFVVLKEGLSQREFINIASKAVINSLLLSYGIRRETTVTVYWAERKILLRIHGSRARNIRPDMESTTGKIKQLLRKEARIVPSPDFQEPCIQPTPSQRNMVLRLVFEKKGFTITYPLSVHTPLCKNSVKTIGFNNPFEALIVINTVIDVCSETLFSIKQ